MHYEDNFAMHGIGIVGLGWHSYIVIQCMESNKPQKYFCTLDYT